MLLPSSLSTSDCKHYVNSSGLGKSTFFWPQSKSMLLAYSQYISKMTSNSRKGIHITFTLNLCPSTMIGHLEHTREVYTKLKAGVETNGLNYNSFTKNSNSRTCNINIKEFVAPKSNNTFKHLSATMHSPRIRLPDMVASSMHKAKTLLTAWGLSPPCLVGYWWDGGWNGYCGIGLARTLWITPYEQFLAKCPSLL